MDVDRDLIRRIVEEVVRKQLTTAASSSSALDLHVPAGRQGIFGTCDDAVAAASQAYRKWLGCSLEVKEACIAAMREVSLEHAASMAELAHAETGLGRPEDKVKKNLLQIHKTPGLEDVKPQVFTGDRGLTLVEKAPFGVICSVTPTTNPVATIINNSISMLAGGNAVVFNPHPRAKECCKKNDSAAESGCGEGRRAGEFDDLGG